MNGTLSYSGQHLIFNINSYSTNNGVLTVYYDTKLINCQDFIGSIMTLWLHNIQIDGAKIEDLKFIDNIDFDCVKEGFFEIDFSKHLQGKNNTFLNLIFEIALDKIDETIDQSKLYFSFNIGEINENSVHQLFANANHKNKSYKNLNDLSQIISKAYSISPTTANEMWNTLWEENRSLQGQQKRYFILVVFRGLMSFLGLNNAVELLLMEEYRLRLILEYDPYGTDDILKNLCKYHISHFKFKLLIDTLNLYQIINNINNINAVNNERLCALVYQVINPTDNTNGQQITDGVLQENNHLIKENEISNFCNYLKDNHCNSTLYYLLLGYETCIKRQTLLKLEDINGCLNALVNFSVIETVEFLVLHEPYVKNSIINGVLRKTIAKHDLFFRHGLDILGNQKQWFETHIFAKEVFLGFFEKRKCMLADFEVEILLRLVEQRNWETLKECFLLIGTNADSCRLGSLLSFISDSIQSYSPKIETSTLNVGIFEVEMEYSVTCGRRYDEFSNLEDRDMKNYRDVLLCLKTVISDQLRETDKLLKSIIELEEKLI